jgi:hypothetical protein
MASVEAPDEPVMTVGSYLGDWLSHMAGRVRLKTLEGYEALIRRHALPHLGPLPLQDVVPLRLQRLYGELLGQGILGAGTVLNLHLVLTQALGQAARWGRAICRRCPELQPCQRYADEAERDLPSGYWCGVWGGETPDERRTRREESELNDPGVIAAAASGGWTAACSRWRGPRTHLIARTRCCAADGSL